MRPETFLERDDQTSAAAVVGNVAWRYQTLQPSGQWLRDACFLSEELVQLLVDDLLSGIPVADVDE